MFGFFSLLPFSTLESAYYNGRDHGFILYIQQQEPNTPNICRVISLDMAIQKHNLMIL